MQRDTRSATSTLLRHRFSSAKEIRTRQNTHDSFLQRSVIMDCQFAEL